MNIRRWWLRTKEKFLPARKLHVTQADGLPESLPRRNLILVQEGSENWCVGMLCPCGCGQRVELPLIKEAHPRWEIHVDGQRRPTLQPSVWLRDGCRSHFFVRGGKVEWV